MRRSRSTLSLWLCVAVFASLFSGFAASAAPLKPGFVPCVGKIAANNVEKGTQIQPAATCCTPAKITSNGQETKQTISDEPVECCLLDKLPVKGKVEIGVKGADPCPPPPAPPDETCGITYPVGAVVGEIPFDQQAYYQPGLVAHGVTINAGTYWVTGLGKADNGDEFYQIVIACQLLFVPANDIVPSYQSPWNGQPLPTTDPIS